MQLDDVIIKIGAISAALLALLALLGYLYKITWKPLRHEYIKFKDVLESYLGRPDTDLVPGMPGLPETIRAMQIQVNNIEKQVFPNGGESLADTVNTIAEEAISIAKQNNSRLLEMKEELDEQREDRIRVVKASSALRAEWAKQLGIEIPEPDELKRWDDVIVDKAERLRDQSKGKHVVE